MPNAEQTTPRFLIQTVAKRAGIKPDLIRAWERRYQAVAPARSNGGQRLYSELDIQRLSLLNRLTGAGYSIGRIAGLSVKELETLLDAKNLPLPRSPPQTPTAIPENIAEQHINDCYAAICNFDSDALEALFESAIAGLGVQSFIENLITPLMARIGEDWQCGVLRPVHEHLALAVIRSTVYILRARYPKPAGTPCIVFATPVGQLHELGVLLAAVIAENNGWRSIYLGPNLPAEEIAAAVKFTQAQAVAIGIGCTTDIALIGKEIRRLRMLTGKYVALFVGGQAAGAYQTVLDETGAHRVESFADLRRLLAELRCELLLGAGQAMNARS